MKRVVRPAIILTEAKIPNQRNRNNVLKKNSEYKIIRDKIRNDIFRQSL